MFHFRISTAGLWSRSRDPDEFKRNVLYRHIDDDMIAILRKGWQHSTLNAKLYAFWVRSEL